MKSQRWSRYNFLLKNVQGKNILYNSYNNGLLELNDALYKELIELSNLDEIDDKSLASFSKEEIEYLKNNYIIVDSDDSIVDQLHNQSMERIYNKKHLILTIAPTHNCNFDCVYCYEKWRSPGSMSDKTEDAIINYLKKQISKHGLESLSLTWYGGEPLLEKNRIKTLGDKINKLNLDIVENEVITNGFLFDEKSIKILDSIGVASIQITIDGIKEHHDKARPLVGGKGTFDQIIKNLDAFFEGEFKKEFLIAIRVNVDKQNIEQFLDIHQWLKDRYTTNNLLIYPGWIYLEDTNPSKCNCFNRNEATDICLELFNKKGIKAEEIYPDDFNFECLIRNTNNMTIGWQGEIYKCYEDIGNKELVIGNIHNETVWSNYDLISKYSVGIDHYTDPKCRSCSYLPICRGGCPKRRFENVYEGKSNDCCTPFKGRLKEYLSLNCK